MADVLAQDVYVFPVSHAQKRLWFFEQLEPGSSVYHVPIGLRLTGNLREESLQASLRALVDRHESLRTTFGQEDGHPVQMVHPELELDTTVYDLADVPEADRVTQAMQLLKQEAHRPFDLSNGPLFRVCLVRLQEREHLLLLNLHHIVADGWSVEILLQELTELYASSATGREATLPDVSLQYPDFAVWQAQGLQDETLAEQLAYWKKHLGTDAAPLQLPTDRPRGATQTYRGAHQTLRLSPDTIQRLQELSQQHGATLFMTMLAAFQALLYRYTGQEVIRVGTPVAGRNRAELEGIIGFFVNTLVMQNRLQGEMSVADLLGQVREVSVAAYSAQDVPFEKLVEELAPKRDLSRSPLFQVMFALRDEPDQFTWPGVEVRVLEIDYIVAKVDLTLQVEKRGPQWEAVLNYNSDLFDAATMQRMLEHYQSLLSGLAADPAQSLEQLPLVTAGELKPFLADWNDTAHPYPRDAGIPELFEAQATQTPDAVALLFAGRQMTYGELNERANQLAHYLRQKGVGPEVPVGVLYERSCEMVTALLAILKAGGAYVPLDPHAPAERVAFQVEDLQIRTVLAQEHLVERHPAFAPLSILPDKEAAVIEQQSVENPVLQTTPDSLAYVVYTSGSTGLPKGVLVPQRGIVRLVKGANYVTISPQDVFLQMATTTFDAATFEIWGSLLNGASLAILPPQLPSAAELGQALRDHSVTICFLTTALFHQLVEDQLSALTSLRQLLVGGEVLSAAHASRALDALPNCRLANVYGPTENTTFSSFYPLTPDNVQARSIPIGKPISNTRLYVLNDDHQLCPVGVPGELHVGGDGLARGYANRPELNEEKFVTSALLEGERLYRTGDLVRWLPDGNLEFLGRLDDQVKIRGFRIELGEVETVLLQHPDIREAIVVAREDTPGERRLAAYVVLEKASLSSGANDWEPSVRRFLKDKLPDYMLPAAYVQMSELPLNRNGKRDRSALPAPDPARRETGAEYAAPRTERERMILRLWQELLQVETIGIHDNFFDLNGHSLLLIKMHQRLEEMFQIKIPVVELFRNPTIDALQRYLQPEATSEPAPVADPAAQPRIDKRREAILRRKGQHK
jgi:aspartate racemase